MHIFNKLSSVIILFISPFFNNSWADINQSWQFAMASEEMTGNAVDRDSIENVQHYFFDKEITLKDNALNVKGLFSCKVIDQEMTPLNYWHSEKTVSFYRDFLKKHGVLLGEEIHVITSSTSDSQCQLPFSEFVKIDNTLMFIYKDRAIWYYPEGDSRLKKKNDKGTSQKVIKIADNVSCQEGSNEIDMVYTQGYIITCIYPKTDLLSTYLKYRDENKNDETLKLLKKEITPGKDEKVTILSDLVLQYKWKSSNELEIEILQSGGVTTLNFHQTDKGTTVKNISSPD